jgi:hypothetical protein
MSITRSTIAIIALSLFLTACNTVSPPLGTADLNAGAYMAKDDLDLQRIGALLERSHSPQEFEGYLNQDDGINNLDLNGDGYADYISVEEYATDDPYQRGLSLYDCFGPDQIQEVGTVVFYRDDPSWRGARVLVTGNDNIYGDNVYYETNWYDRPVDLITFVFGGHDRYRSPYYYDYYPPDYVVYEVVDTPVYVTRVQRLYSQPILVFVARPDFIDKIKIKSPNRDKHFDRIYAKLAKPTKQQADFREHNPVKPERVKADKPGKQEPALRSDDRDKHEKPNGEGKPPPAEKPRPEAKPPGSEKPQEQARPPKSTRSGPPAAKPKNNPGGGHGKKKG